MASTRIVEEERGSYTGRIGHKHNGYYAGDFGSDMRPAGACRPLLAASTPVRSFVG